MVAANARTAITFALSPGQASDAKAGRDLLGGLGPLPAPLHLIMDGAYDDNQTLQLALDFGFLPVVPPRPNRLEPWQYDRALYRKRNEIERLFRRLKGFRRIFSRFSAMLRRCRWAAPNDSLLAVIPSETCREVSISAPSGHLSGVPTSRE
jgi:transposase